MNFKVVIEKDEDGYFVATVPSLPGCISQGATEEEALSNIKEAIHLHVEASPKTACLSAAKRIHMNICSRLIYEPKTARSLSQRTCNSVSKAWILHSESARLTYTSAASRRASADSPKS